MTMNLPTAAFLCLTNSRRRNRLGNGRWRGAATLEMAIALSLFLALVLGMIDLSYGLFRYHVLTHATHQLARQAVVRGALADETRRWGPTAVHVTASSKDPVTRLVVGQLTGWNLAEVQIDVQWLDGGNDPRVDDRVQVSMSAPYRPLMTFILGNPTITLRSATTMQIAH